MAAKAGRTIAFERVWRGLTLPFVVAAAFLAFGLLGAWDLIPPPWRPLGLVVFAALFLATLYPLFRLRAADRSERLSRIDGDGGIAHRPAAALDDKQALGRNDPGSAALWDLHRKRAAAALAAARVAPPRPGNPRRDPWALRIAALLLAVGSAFIAGRDWPGRLGAAFAWKAPPPSIAAIRLDAWVDPPAYTRLPPILIDLASAKAERSFRAPIGSVVVVRLNGAADVAVTVSGALTEFDPEVERQAEAARKAAEEATAARLAGKPEAPASLPATTTPAAAPAVPQQRQWRLGADAGTVVIRRGGGEIARLDIASIPDRPPTIALIDPPERVQRGDALSVFYRIDDDYGVVSAEAEFMPLPRANAGGKVPRPLVEPPKAPLALPPGPGGIGETRATVDLSTHAYAGARVRMVLITRDDLNQEGRSEPATVTLPQRIFVKPLARAIVEQRRELLMDADARPMVLEALYALMIAPHIFTPEPAHFLGLRIGVNRLVAAKTDDELREVADYLWEMALRIEDGDLSDAERELRTAEERLRQALDNNASPEELRRLTEELRAALDRYMRELAEQMRRDRRQAEAERQPPPDQRPLRQQDMRSLMDRMDEAMRRGDREEARRLLEQLQEMMQGLRQARPQDRQLSPEAREMMRSLQELDRMIREQQGLRDDTFRQDQRRDRADRQRPRRGDQNRRGQPQQGQRQPGQQQPGQQQPGEGEDEGEGEDQQEGNPRMGQGDRPGGQGESLAQRQERLRRQLEQLRRRMQGQGLQNEQGLDDAEEAMRQAERSLGRGENGDAADAQGRALEALRRGAQGLARQMQPGGQPGEGEFGDGDPAEGFDDRGRPTGPRGRAAEREDPLGRPNRTRDWQDHRGHVPKAGETPLQRAQRVMEELRRRLSDPNRNREELDYLRRLLTPY